MGLAERHKGAAGLVGEMQGAKKLGGGDRIGLSEPGMRSRGMSARWGNEAGRDEDLIIPAAPCPFTLQGVCSGKRRSTEGETSEPPLTVAQSTRVCPQTHLGGCRVPAPSAVRGCVPAARVRV